MVHLIFCLLRLLFDVTDCLQVPSTLSQSLNLAGSSSSSSSDTSSVASKIQEAASRYEENVIDSGEDDQYYDNYVGYENYEAYNNPLKQLENLKKEREELMGKKSDYDFMRRSDFPELAYSY